MDDETVKQLLSLLPRLPEENRARVMAAATGIDTAAPRRGLSNKERSMPYYKEKYGMALKPTLDQLIADPSYDAVFLFANFPSLKKNTLYLSIYQGWLWLIGKADPDKRYRRLKEACEIRRNAAGFIIQRKVNNVKTEFKKPDIIRKTEAPKPTSWLQQVEDYLESGEEGKPFKLEKLTMSAEEVDSLKASLSQLTNVKFVIETHCIKLLKLTEEQLKELAALQQ